jgi:hypothetical protein
MRLGAVALGVVLVLAQAAPARADDAGNLATVLQRAQARRHRGVTLLGVGLGLAAIGVAGLIVVASSSSCADDFGSTLGCALPRLVAGGWIAAGGFGLGVPLVGTGLAQSRAGREDDTAARDQLPPNFFAERATRRIRRGRNLAIAGSVISLVAAGLGATALWALESNNHNPPLFQATTALGTLTGVIGVGLLSSGVTLVVMGRHDASAAP